MSIINTSMSPGAKGFVSIQIDNASIAQIDKNLKAVSWMIRNEILEKAIFTAANIPMEAAKTKVPVRTGELKSSIMRRHIRDIDSVGAAVVASRSGGHKGGYYAHLIERGHRLVVRKKGGGGYTEKGMVAAHPFMFPALAENTNQILDSVAQSVRTRVNRARSKSGQGKI